jgi:glycosyltransferase involved in cell wall biosynthesis
VEENPMTEKLEHKNIRISAIICTYNRETLLPLCLEALVNQTLDDATFEVIVVDNNSTDRSPAIAAEFSKTHSNMRAVLETKQGLSAARNRGLAEAQAPIAAFTDDDAIPAADWLERLVARFDTLGEEFVAVGGEIDPVWEGGKPDWLEGDILNHAVSASLRWSRRARELSNSEFLIEANSAYRIAPIVERGGFPEALGRIGNILLSGENAVNNVLAQDGYRFFFDPEIRVKHNIAKSRLTKEWFRRRFFWQGVTTFFVNQYLRENGCDIDPTTEVQLPMCEASWANALDAEAEGNFVENLNVLFDLGYALAASKVLMGR